ncbi:MAG: FAD-binding protein, partial [Paramuribaculum sp.]|nr:FAD-binding protein [Paramuribaculum sp.]
MTYKYDYLVIGSGIAGMSFALKSASEKHRVALVCKTTLDEANTALAQGGVC